MQEISSGLALHGPLRIIMSDNCSTEVGIAPEHSRVQPNKLKEKSEAITTKY